MNLPPLLLAGPTAVGKSELALRLAETGGGEIVSVDSMQVYRGLDIGTAKPSREERCRVPQHLIDVVSHTEPFDVARFLELARQAVADIEQRGRWALLCGGTGLYFKAYIEGLGAAPPADPALRRELELVPMPRLLEELAARDPQTFARIDRGNPRRIVRAVEVLRLTGRPAHELRPAWTSAIGRAATPRFYALRRTAPDLGRRIDARVAAMFAQGLVEETRRLLEHGLEANRTAMQAIGYRQVVEHLRGVRGLAETIALVQQRTRQFARRQMTWLRRQLPVTWIDVAADEPVERVAQRICL